MAQPNADKPKSIVDHIKDIMARKDSVVNAMSKGMEEAKRAKESQPASYETSRKKR